MVRMSRQQTREWCTSHQDDQDDQDGNSRGTAECGFAHRQWRGTKEDKKEKNSEIKREKKTKKATPISALSFSFLPGDTV